MYTLQAPLNSALDFWNSLKKDLILFPYYVYYVNKETSKDRSDLPDCRVTFQKLSDLLHVFSLNRAAQQSLCVSVDEESRHRP